MIRPIDTQTIYQQTQEIASREQLRQQGEMSQQNQFAATMQKEVKEKQETVHSLEKEREIDNDLDKNKGKGQHKGKNKKQKQSNSQMHAGKVEESTYPQSKIDIRI